MRPSHCHPGGCTAITVGWHWGLLCGFATPLEMLVVPWGKETVRVVALVPSPFLCHLCLVCDHLCPRSCSCVSVCARAGRGSSAFAPGCRWHLGGPSEGELGLKSFPPSHLLSGIQLMQPKKAPPSRARFKQTRARWWLAYTLLNNPSLTACRKTALSDPTANGTQLSSPKP